MGASEAGADSGELRAQDAWDASDDDEKKPVKPAGPPPPVRQKGITKMKIAEKEAAEKARLAEIAARVS
jgi:translation initiation factor 3 subunit J